MFNLDLSTFVEHDDDIENRFNYFFNCTTINFVLNITAPECKLKGTAIFGSKTYINSSGYYVYDYLIGTINITNTIYYYNHLDNISYNYDTAYYLFCVKESTINGTINGCNIFIYPSDDNDSDYILKDNSNLIIKSPVYTIEEVNTILNRNKPINPIVIFNKYNNHSKDYKSSFIKCINVDDYYFVNCIFYDVAGFNEANSYIKNINKKDKTFCILNNVATDCIFNITTNNNSNIYMSNSYRTDITFNDEFNDVRSEYNKIILNNEDYTDGVYKTITYLSTRTLINNTYYNNPFTIDVSQYDIETLNEIYDFNTCVYIFNLSNVHNVIIYDFDKEYKFQVKILNFNQFIIKPTDENESYNYYDLSNTYYNKSNYFYTNKIDSIIQSYLTSSDKYTVPSILYINDKENSNFPNLIGGDNNKITCHKVFGIVDNINLEDALNYISSGQDRTDVFGIRIDGIKNLICDEEEINIIYGDANKTLGHDLIIHSVEKPVNITIGENGVYSQAVSYYIWIRAHEYYNNENLYLKTFACKQSLLKGNNNNESSCSFRYLCKDCSITFSAITLIRLDDMNYLRELNINGDYIDTPYISRISTDKSLINLTKFTINNIEIRSDLNLQECSKLTQESINSIVTPTNFASGITLTINTIPFQYITEEQKQALVNAGVTLVEYIPTETTE